MIIFILNTIFKLITLTYYSILSQLICCIGLILLIYVLKNKLKTPRDVSLLTYKIKNFIVPVTAVLLYFFIFILLLTLYRIVNIYRVIDLKKLFVDLSTYIISSDKFALLLYILLVFLIVRVLLFFFTL